MTYLRTGAWEGGASIFTFAAHPANMIRNNKIVIDGKNLCCFFIGFSLVLYAYVSGSKFVILCQEKLVEYIARNEILSFSHQEENEEMIIAKKYVVQDKPEPTPLSL